MLCGIDSNQYGVTKKVVHTWVVILKLSQIVDIVIDNDVQVVALVMRRDVGFGKRLRHFCCTKETGYLIIVSNMYYTRYENKGRIKYSFYKRIEERKRDKESKIKLT